MLPDGSSGDEFMAYELRPGALSGGTVSFLAEKEFERAENDDVGFYAFHTGFMKKNYPGKVTLRPFFDGDIPLVEKWLRCPHVSRWYENPGAWLREMRERRGEFSFITHFIAEYEGVPFGFCQYYDRYFSGIMRHGRKMASASGKARFSVLTTL